MTSAGDFKRAMRHLAAGVAIVATEHDGRRAGLTVTAVCSFSADPPMLLVCIGVGASAHDLVEASGRFSVNLLAQGQEELAQRFSGRTGMSGEDRFAAGQWRPLATGAPVLNGSLVSLDCRLAQVTSLATHSVFIGTVVDVAAGNAATPLLYAHGTYGTFSPAEARDW